jgi:hypothetical protein
MTKTTVAFARVVESRIPKLVKLIVAFNVYERNSRGKLKFPAQGKCAYVSGDFDYSDLTRQLAVAESKLGSTNIQFGD